MIPATAKQIVVPTPIRLQPGSMSQGITVNPQGRALQQRITSRTQNLQSNQLSSSTPLPNSAVVIPSNVQFAETCLSLGKIFASEGRREMAYNSFNIGISSSKENTPLLHAALHYEMANLLYSIQDWTRAFENLKCGLSHAVGSANMTARLLHLLATVFFARNKVGAIECDPCSGIKALERAVALPSLDHSLFLTVKNLLQTAKEVFRVHLVPSIDLSKRRKIMQP